MSASVSLGEFVVRLKQGNVVTRPEGESWPEMIVRTTVPGRVCEIDGDTFDYFLEILPPQMMNAGWFAFAEGEDFARVFWVVNTGNTRSYFCRQLDEQEHEAFRRTAYGQAPPRERGQACST